MKVIEHIELVGENVIVASLQEEHVEALFEISQEPAIWEFLTTKVYTIDDMKDIVTAALKMKEEGSQDPFVVIDKKTNRIVGTTRLLDISHADKKAEIGWTWYHPSVWRTYVNTECKYLLLKYCFETLQYNRVQFKTDGRNERSQKAIARLGAVYEGTIRKERVLPNGYVRDAALFSIISEEWGSVKERLEGYMAR
nr:GNAT family protein [Priestia taiwanensis]